MQTDTSTQAFRESLSRFFREFKSDPSSTAKYVQQARDGLLRADRSLRVDFNDLLQHGDDALTAFIGNQHLRALPLMEPLVAAVYQNAATSGDLVRCVCTAHAAANGE
ncbi:MAG: uncharacterized protein KVP18_003127 [Porospora cf. gigantea A]|uniref:uncharacterized protein n=1 Tax=Porospora cf. gigantea A TaxID=2853593 RepID=UPI00355A37C9|nr:MAG: hypothetical protein KVP18_003127 [Porospora cf. gigantea A]